MKTLQLLFGMKDRVSRKQYMIWGASLMILKYLGELGLYFYVKAEILTPLNFFSPLLANRYPGFGELPDFFGPAVVLWSIPFIWIGAGMSIRRAADAGLTPWTGILFFLPVVNYAMMLALSVVPSKAGETWQAKKDYVQPKSLLSPIMLSLILALVGALISWYNTNFLKTYSSSLFLWSPLVLGSVQGFLLNNNQTRDFEKTLGYVFLTIVSIHLFLLIFALEGLICLIMSLPISLCLGFIGAVFGTAIAKNGKPNSLSPTMLVLVLPLMPLIESRTIDTHRDVVLSTIEINVTPEKVWPNVVKFSDLPPNDDWLFKLGVAHPLRARIEGQGVGAIRHCEFSTGAFVEPITVWNEPSHLAFNVQYQPQPMKEVSIYDHVDAPHLDGYFRSVKGEFRLVPTEGGGTRLEGRTWYEIDMHPGWYWQIYGRWFIHKIHLRVLDHIKNLSEKSAS